MNSIENDAKQLLEKLLSFTGGVSGKAKIIFNPNLKPLIRSGLFSYQFEATKPFLIDKGIIKFIEIAISKPFFLYSDVEVDVVYVDFEKAREFLRQPKSKTITENWDRKSGIWTFIIPGEKDINIKLGKEKTGTNETFYKLHSMKNKDIRSSEIWHYLSEVFKNDQKLNIGSKVASLRKYIKRDLSKKYEHLVVIHHDKHTKTYRLELKF